MAGETRKVIEGVPPLSWEQSGTTTFAGALAAALAATDHPCDYTDLMGWSGLAFRTRWYRTTEGEDWCPSSPVGEMPEEIEALQRATGWEIRPEVEMERDAAQVARLGAAIAAAVDARRPVLVYPPDLNVAVACGYEEGGRAVLVQAYGYHPTSSLPVDQLGFLTMFLEEAADPLPAAEALREALRIAVRNWRREPLGQLGGGPGLYHYGEAALSVWADDLARAESLTEAERGKLTFVSGWNFSSLLDARKTAVEFLGRHQELLGAEAAKWLQQAREAYAGEVTLLRERGQEGLGEASAREGEAVGHLKQALAVD